MISSGAPNVTHRAAVFGACSAVLRSCFGLIIICYGSILLFWKGCVYYVSLYIGSM